MAFTPRIIPRLKLPKLVRSGILTAVSLPILTLAARSKLICGLISQLFTPIQKVYQAIANVKATATNVANALKNAATSVSNQVASVVNGTIANLTGQVKALVGLPQAIVSSFNSTKDKLSKQSKDIKSIITGEIDCIADSITNGFNVSSIDASIKKEAAKEVNKLSNNELKTLAEDPAKKNSYTTGLTQKVIDKASPGIANNLSSNNTTQVKSVEKLETLSTKVDFDAIYELPVKLLQKNTRLQLLEILDNRLSNFMNYYPNDKFPELKAARIAEKARIEADIAADPGTIKYIYIRQENFIILR